MSALLMVTVPQLVMSIVSGAMKSATADVNDETVGWKALDPRGQAVADSGGGRGVPARTVQLAGAGRDPRGCGVRGVMGLRGRAGLVLCVLVMLFGGLGADAKYAGRHVALVLAVAGTCLLAVLLTMELWLALEEVVVPV